MSDSNEAALLSALARLNVLEQFVRMMFRAMNSEQQITADALMQMAESIKSRNELSMLSESAAYQTAAVDAFFNEVVSDLRKDAEGR